jgi:hypothetical protein
MLHSVYSARWLALLFVAVVSVTTGCTKHSAPSAVAPRNVARPTTSSISPNLPTPPTFKKPDHVRGIYLTAWSAASKSARARLYAYIKGSLLNSFVIDVRDTGEMYWDTGIPFAEKVHANEHAIRHPAPVMAELAAHGVYPIARIACFRDDFVAKYMADRCVQTPNGKPWRDKSGHGWLDPYNKANWDYIGATIDFALDIGFPEIQLDYVRFASEGTRNPRIYPSKAKYKDGKVEPQDVISEFATAMRDKVKARGATISADIFGIISISKSDQGIGQELEKVAAPFDVISPMVYPSHFAAGEYGIKAPVAEPYNILIHSLGDFKRRLPDKPIRPWLQDFSINVPNQPHVEYGIHEVQEQIRAAHDMGYDDFLLWNAGNRYTPHAVDTVPTGPPNPPVETPKATKTKATKAPR